jgi:hypothetical protein
VDFIQDAKDYDLMAGSSEQGNELADPIKGA